MLVIHQNKRNIVSADWKMNVQNLKPEKIEVRSFSTEAIKFTEYKWQKKKYCKKRREKFPVNQHLHVLNFIGVCKSHTNTTIGQQFSSLLPVASCASDI